MTVPTAPLGDGLPPLIAHVIYRLAIGGLENGLVNLINHMPADRYRHVIVCLTDSTEFRDRLVRAEIPVISLRKREGKDLGLQYRLWQLLRRMRPAIVHTRNLPALEFMLPATLAGIRGRVHSEHGLDVNELHGSNAKYNLLRKRLDHWSIDILPSAPTWHPG